MPAIPSSAGCRSRRQRDDDVDGGERGEEQRRPADAALPEVEDGPVGRPLGMARELAPLQPHAERDEQQPGDEEAGIATKTTRPAYGLVNSPPAAAIGSAMNATADVVVISAPAIASGMARTSASRHARRVT